MLGFEIGSLKLRLSFSFFAAVALAASFGGEYARTVLVCVLSALVHECGHMTAMLCFSLPPDFIYFYAGGIMLPADRLDCGRPAACVILLSGSLVNFICAGLCFLFAGAGDFVFANIALGLFNLLPFSGSDGCRLISELSKREPPAAVKLSAALLPASLCCVGAYYGYLPFFLAATTCYIIISGFSGE